MFYALDAERPQGAPTLEREEPAWLNLMAVTPALPQLPSRRGEGEEPLFAGEVGPKGFLGYLSRLKMIESEETQCPNNRTSSTSYLMNILAVP